MDLDSVSVYWKTRKKELGKYPAIVTSGLANNTYVNKVNGIVNLVHVITSSLCLKDYELPYKRYLTIRK